MRIKDDHQLTGIGADGRHRIEALFALADQIEARFQKAQRQVAALTPSLLARAFAGKLVPQDPTDEPAEKLLERIRRNGESKA